MRKVRHLKKAGQKTIAFMIALGLTVSLMPAAPVLPTKAADFTGTLTEVKGVERDKTDVNIVWVTFNDNVKAKLTFLDNGIFRYNVDPTGEFSNYAVPRSSSHAARIQQYPDTSVKYAHPEASVESSTDAFTVKAGDVTVIFDKDTAKMTIKDGSKTVMEEKEALSINGTSTVQTLVKQEDENFYGGGTQNGRFVHTGEKIHIANESGWTDGGVASPNPFYYTTGGYGVLRNTFRDGDYDFGKAKDGTVTAEHEENEFDAYYFVSDASDGRGVAQELLQGYYKVTGNPALLPEYAFYEGHLNAYNRDSWSDTSGQKAWTIKGTDSASSEGTTIYESGMAAGYKLSDGMFSESLNGTGPTVAADKYPNVTTPYKYSARAVIYQYVDYDMPLGYFLPNDGYGAGYGQNGYGMTGGVNTDGSSSAERLAAVDANVANLKAFADYAKTKGVETGLWTQSYLVPDSNPNTEWQLLRDFKKEVQAGVTTLKTDVAWVGYGYSMQLDGVKTAYDTATTTVNYRPNIISLDGWAGSQRYNSIWTGDQYGGNWEYIRFHIPTYIGTSLSGNPNVGSDMDGIFSGDKIVSTRDYQWKIFTQEMLNMDGWGSYAKTPYTFGDPYTGINRMYLKTKAKLMPYLYTTAYSSSNINTGNQDTGLPMIRAMFLEYPDDPYAFSRSMQYQFMFGSQFLVAPIYQNTADTQGTGDDVRNNIYLPDKDAVWVDFFTGEQYRGGQTLNNFAAPLWKLPVFVKNGSIIPQYEENNSPSEIDRTNRIVEFWPAGSTEYTAVEDDGTYIENEITEDEEYGKIDNISYGDHVSTTYTSEVSGTTATLTAEKSAGTYTGYQQNKNTTFVVHVSQKPTGITAKNGETALNTAEVTTKEAFEQAVPEAGKAVWFYDAAPEIETYASEKETEFKNMVKDVKVAPKLYVKFAKADAKAVDQTLVIDGFANDGNLPAEKENTGLGVPTLTEDEEARTPSSITVNWTAVEGATSYEVMVDGIINTAGAALTYTHTDLDYSSSHTYKVRSRNADGYSAWSQEQTFTSANDPWKDTPDPQNIEWTGTLYGNHRAELAFDKEFQAGDGGFHSGDNAIGQTLTVDYGLAWEFDRIEYYPRDDAGNGTVTKMRLETSLDGVTWTEAKVFDWNANAETKTMTVGAAARYIRFTPLAAVGNFFSASEIKAYVKENSRGFAVGSTLGNAEVADGDYTNMKNYLGMCVKDETFVNQIQKRYGDINGNGYYDAYDYAFTMFQLDGGTKKKGNVSGTVGLQPSVTEIAAGETFTIDFYAEDTLNVNAAGKVISYDPDVLEFVSVQKSNAIEDMEDLSIHKTYADGTAYVNLAFANRGDKALYSGSGTLATVTVKAKKALSLSGTDAIDLTAGMLIGPDYSTEGTVLQGTLESPVVQQKYQQSDFAITMTNEKLPTDNGTNVSSMIQQGSYNGLFDGNKGRDFEFKWDIQQNFDNTGALPAYVTLPVTLHFNLKKPGTLRKLVVYNANKANGYVTAVKAKVNYADGTSSEEFTKNLTGSYEDWSDYSTFTFSFADDKEADGADVTILKAVKRDGTEIANMLTLAEIDLMGSKAEEQTDYTGLSEKYEEYAKIVNTDNRYTEESWKKFQDALAAAKAVLDDTAADQAAVDAALENLNLAYQALAEVPAAVDRTEITNKCNTYAAVTNTGNTYTAESWKTFQDALVAAKAVLADEKSDQAVIDSALKTLEAAYAALKKVSDSGKPDPETPEPGNKTPVVKGKIYTVNGENYQVLTTFAAGGTVKYNGYAGNGRSTVKIHDTVTLEGAVYKVTVIAKKALYQKSKVKKVTVGNNISTIEASAFKKCTGLKSVTLGKNVKSIGKHAFCGDKKLRTMIVKSTKLKKVAKHSLAQVKNLKVKAPKKQMKKYAKLFKGKGAAGLKVVK